MPYDNLPVALDGHPWLYLSTVFSLLLTLLLALEWLWRTCWAYFDQPYPLKHPRTVVRTVMLLLLLQLVTRIGPDVWAIMRWPKMSQSERIATAILDSRMDTSSFIWMGLAWLVWRLGEPFISYQLDKQPLPVHLWPTAAQMRRPLLICLGVFLIAFALTFLR